MQLGIYDKGGDFSHNTIISTRVSGLIMNFPSSRVEREKERNRLEETKRKAPT